MSGDTSLQVSAIFFRIIWEKFEVRWIYVYLLRGLLKIEVPRGNRFVYVCMYTVPRAVPCLHDHAWAVFTWSIKPFMLKRINGKNNLTIPCRAWLTDIVSSFPRPSDVLFVLLSTTLAIDRFLDICDAFRFWSSETVSILSSRIVALYYRK